MKKPNIILIGGGGHCMSVIDVIETENKYNILGILDENKAKKEILNYPIIGNDDLILDLICKDNYFLITVGQIKSPEIRIKIANKLIKNNAKIATVISPLAYVSKHAIIKEGSVVMHHATINAGASIGSNCIINTKSNIEHGCVIGDFCHISTGAIVNGDTTIGKGSFLGSNSTISHAINISEHSIIAAGSFVKSTI